MIRTSILGTLYGYWLQSALFSFLRAVQRPFSRAFRNSMIIGFFERPSVIERSYENSFFTRAVHAVIDGLLCIPAKLFACLRTAAGGSVIVRLCSGSFILNYEFLLGAFVFVMFSVPHADWSNSYGLLGALLMFLLFGLLAAAGKRRPLYPDALGFPFLLFVFSCFLSLIFTRDLNDSIRVLMFFLTAFLLTYVIVADITDEGRLMKLLGFIYAAVMMTSLYAVAQRIMGVKVDMLLTDLANNPGVPGRVYSTLDNPNNYAEFLVLFTPLCAAFAVHVKKPFPRLVLSLAIALPMLGMIMTYSRSGWISILLAAIVFVYYSDRKLIPLFFLLCVLAVPFLPSSVVTRIDSIFSGNDTSAAHRIYVWHGILLLLADKHQWLTGIGIGPETFGAVYPFYARKWATEGVFHSQMLYLELFLELGTLGFVSFMWMMFRSVKDAACALCRTDRTAVKVALIACCASFIGLAAGSVFEYIWYYPRILFAYFILFGICLAAARMTPWNKGFDYE